MGDGGPLSQMEAPPEIRIDRTAGLPDGVQPPSAAGLRAFRMLPPRRQGETSQNLSGSAVGQPPLDSLQSLSR